MPTAVGPNSSGEENLVFGYDLGDTSNSYIGEPTTNTVRYSNNVTGSDYGYNNEYEPSQFIKTWYPNFRTPLGFGATLCTQQAVNSYYHALNWFDDSEDGKRCLSAFIYPVTSGITNFYLGMIADGSNGVYFNLDTLEITYGGGISNRNAFINPVIGYPGWYRVGANIEGREGGWIASIGIGQYQQYTPTAPFKSFFLCGLQYERGGPTHVTQPLPSLNGTETTRSATQGLLDLTKDSTINISSVSFNAQAQPYFDGTDDFINLGDNSLFDFTNGIMTVEAIVKFPSSWTGGSQYPNLISKGATAGWDTNGWSLFGFRDWPSAGQKTWGFGMRNGSTNNITSVYNRATDVYLHLVATLDGTTVKLYENGTQVNTNSQTINPADNTTPVYIGRDANTQYFPGEIPYTRIYNRALSASEVQNNYQNIKTRFNLS
jgi:hypothetical protein